MNTRAEIEEREELMDKLPESGVKAKRMTPRRVALGWIVLCLSLVGCAQNMRDGSRLRPYEQSEFFEDRQSARPLLDGTVARGELRTDEHFFTGMTGGAGAGDTVSSDDQDSGTAGGQGQGSEDGGPDSGGQGGGTPGDPATTGGTDTGDEEQGNTSQDGATGQNQSGQQGDATPVDTFPYPVTREILERGQVRYNGFCAPCHAITGNGDGMIVQRGFSAPPSFHSDRLREAPVGHYFDVITNGFGRMYAYGSRVTPADRWAIIAYIRALQLSQNATIEDVPAEQRDQLQGAGE